ncbi:DNA breaking-rejoining enzyme [Armillaria borealis]|uniref:DNA breaking-rejoining enzyme n=1 Tax=Armillaria borealis TaxID=47425 RepID=A0AA39IXP5_9AGAR|nr:DNA breaking-rejoining enzyme [Armillaria borealis]
MYGVNRKLDNAQRSFSHAEKLCAAITYSFQGAGGHGRTAWDRVTAAGNPSISKLVSSYMLRDTPMSTRAITAASSIFYLQLYDHNHLQQNWNNTSLQPGNWCGGNMCRLLQAVYLVAFTCLLCINEIEPFVLRTLPAKMSHLCPVRALAQWIQASKIYYDRPILAKNSPMITEVFLELFHNNLFDIEISLYAYGTHSFRRGGCQWLSVDLHWSIWRICEWGGWSTDFTHLMIVKYLISWNDDPILQ